jgi:hypothetical protein
MINTALSGLRVAAFCLPLALVASCGSGSSQNPDPGAPAGATVTVDPFEKAWLVTLGTCTNTFMQDTYFNIVVKNASGVPLPGVGIDVSLDLSPHTFIPPGFSVMFLYDDLDGDGFYTDLVSAYPKPYYTKTGSSGTKVLRVQYDIGGCLYGGDLNVITGPAFGNGHISVEEQT